MTLCHNGGERSKEEVEEKSQAASAPLILVFELQDEEPLAKNSSINSDSNDDRCRFPLAVEAQARAEQQAFPGHHGLAPRLRFG